MPSSNLFSASRYLVASIFLTMAFVALIGGTNVSLNLFGLYGEATGLRLLIYSGNDRLAKYLLCRRYVPTNYECLLMGNSVSRIFPVNAHNIAGQRVYNGAVGGGTVGEYLQMVELCCNSSSSMIRTVIMFVDPVSVQSSLPRERVTAEQLDLMSLCSTFAIRLWAEYALCLSGKNRAWYDEDGVWLASHYKGINWIRDFKLLAGDMAASRSGFPLGEDDIERLRGISDLCRQNNLTLICIATPIPAARYKRLKPRLRPFYSEVSTCLGTEVLNPNESSDPELQKVLLDPASFRDGNHFFPSTAAKVWEICSTRIIEPRLP